MSFSDVAFVWPGPNPPTQIAGAPACTVGLWPTALGCETLGWDATAGPSAEQVERIRAKRVFLVNLFCDSMHVSHIRAVHPQAVVVARPDPHLQLVLKDEPLRLWQQMAAADVVGARTEVGAELYGTLLEKPAVWLPSPIGPADAFRKLWDTPKRERLIASEHNGIQANSGATVAALAAVQRATGWPVHFYRANQRTRELADLAGLKVTWCAAVEYPEMAKATAAATWGIDLYAANAQGRNLMTHAMAGTPVVGSCTNNPAGPLMVDPHRPREAAQRLLSTGAGAYERIRRDAFDYVDAVYGFAASRQRVRELLEAVL